MSKISRAAFVARANALWALSQNVYQLRKPLYRRTAVREPLQLLVAALMYHRRALRAFNSRMLHEKIRARGGRALGQLLAKSPAELLGTDCDRLFMPGTMHLASAALRLPVAVLETIDANQVAKADFSGLIKRSTAYWDEPKVLRALGTLDCCGAGAIDYRRALAIVLLVRNDLMHGEKAKGYSRKNPRERLLSRAFRCRLIEAEQCLIEWSLSRLSTAPLRKRSMRRRHP